MTKTKKAPNSKELEQAARLLAFVYETGFLSRKRMFWFSFLRGVVSGVGGFIGATIGISLLLWIVSIFTDIPLIGALIENLEQSLKSN